MGQHLVSLQAAAMPPAKVLESVSRSVGVGPFLRCLNALPGMAAAAAAESSSPKAPPSPPSKPDRQGTGVHTPNQQQVPIPNDEQLAL